MASAKIAKVKKQTTAPKKVTENEDGRKLSDYEILTTIGKNFVIFKLMNSSTWLDKQ